MTITIEQIPNGKNPKHKIYVVDEGKLTGKHSFSYFWEMWEWLEERFEAKPETEPVAVVPPVDD